MLLDEELRKAVQTLYGNRHFVVFAFEIPLETLIVLPDKLFGADYAGIGKVAGAVFKPFHTSYLKAFLPFGFH